MTAKQGIMLPLVLVWMTVSTGCDGAEATTPEPSARETPEAAANPDASIEKPEPRPPAEPDRFTVMAVGDVMMDKIAQSFIAKNGTDYPFGDVTDEFDKHDVVIANLEAPIASDGEQDMKWKKFHFMVKPENAAALQDSGIDIVTLANNHMMDYGAPALLETVTTLDQWGIRHAGAGGNLEAARAPANMVVSSTELIILAYCAFSPSKMHANDERAGVAALDIDQIREDLEVHKRDDNVVLVALHWGVQHTDQATPGQRALARDILDAGADAILGHHPHRPQEVEVHDGKIIAYSLGNFLFGYYNPIYRNNIALVLEFEGTKIVGARILPVDGRNARIRFRPKFMTGKKGRNVLEHVAKLSKRLGTVMTIEDDGASIDLAASM